MAEQIHEVIWLQPWCDGCEKNAYGSDGRQWCEDDVWSKCDECEQASVKYVLASSPSVALEGQEPHSKCMTCGAINPSPERKCKEFCFVKYRGPSAPAERSE